MQSYVSQLTKLSHYQKFPKMLPWVGNGYVSDSHRKLLIVGESHFFPPESTVHLDAEKWYNADVTPISVDEEGWLCTSNLIEHATASGFKNFHTYHQIHIALQQMGLKSKEIRGQHEFMFNEVAFMNYFLRPAITNSSIKDIACVLDKTRAYDNFIKVIDILVPDIIIFTSKYSVVSAEEYPLFPKTDSMKIFYTYTNHPSTSWWNRPTRPSYFKGKTSKQHFIASLTENHFLNP